jgi:RecA/RadA recombinase
LRKFSKAKSYYVFFYNPKPNPGIHMSALRDKLLKNTTIEHTAVLSESKIYGKGDMIPTVVPMMNVALSGRLDGGLTPGLLQVTGPSKHFKSNFTLLLCSAFLNKYPEGIILFYDSEFGTKASYFDSFNLPMDQFVHSPITDLEQFKFDLMQQVEGLTREDKVMIIVDSLGSLASKKEVEDALSGKSAADMTRAKQIKSVFRMVTPHLVIKDIPMVAINHIYMTQEMYSKPVVSGGTGAYLAANDIWIIGREQEKDKDKSLTGYTFSINIDKSRSVKEKSRIEVTVTFDGGIEKWSGLFDVAVQGGFIHKVNAQSYNLFDQETGEIDPQKYTRADLEYNDEVWSTLVTNPKFKDYIHETFALGNQIHFQETE